MTRLQLTLSLAALAALAAPLAWAEEVPPAPAPVQVQDAPATPPKARLAAWRAGARQDKK